MRPTRLIGRILLTALLALVGGALLYFAGWIVWADILPQVRSSGLSLERSNMILNRDWRGNQLYLLVGLYLLAGGGLLAGARKLWRRPAST